MKCVRINSFKPWQLLSVFIQVTAAIRMTNSEGIGRKKRRGEKKKKGRSNVFSIIFATEKFVLLFVFG